MPPQLISWRIIRKALRDVKRSGPAFVREGRRRGEEEGGGKDGVSGDDLEGHEERAEGCEALRTCDDGRWRKDQGGVMR